jgi:enamine deaminase RidA (YjgF/YER057c/UK114 family)/8-oxo-dGTP pyrophosphatase MutT (NUDIX family)
MRHRARLVELGLSLPPVAPPVASYLPAVRSGNLVWTSGQLPLRDGQLPAAGKVGGQVTAEQGRDLARTCALNALAAIDALVGLDSVVQVVKVVGFVASVPDFVGQPAVVNGASELLGEIFGAAGHHARSAVGVAALPLDAPVEIAVPREAATVALLRDAPGGFEVYLLRRVAGLAFAPGRYVFPGGAVDDSDAEPDLPWCGGPPADWSGLLSAGEAGVRALVCAAVRETFEECGVLLAGASAGDVVADVGTPEWERERVALEAREQSLGELVRRRGLVVRADLLHPLAHWITPVQEPRRFDTRFFVASLPSGQQCRNVGGEADHRLWLRPEAALEQSLPMLPPTIAVLQTLASHADIASVLTARPTVTPVLPVLSGPG